MILNSATKSLLRSRVRSLVCFCDIMDCGLLPHAFTKFFYIPSLATVFFGLFLYIFEKTIFPGKTLRCSCGTLLVLAMMHGDFELTTVDGSADSDSINEDGLTDV